MNSIAKRSLNFAFYIMIFKSLFDFIYLKVALCLKLVLISVHSWFNFPLFMLNLPRKLQKCNKSKTNPKRTQNEPKRTQTNPNFRTPNPILNQKTRIVTDFMDNFFYPKRTQIVFIPHQQNWY